MEVWLRCGVFLAVVGPALRARWNPGSRSLHERPSTSAEEARICVAGFCILTRMEEPPVDVRLLPRLVLLDSDAAAGVDASICRARLSGVTPAFLISASATSAATSIETDQCRRSPSGRRSSRLA
jgi:hypothetical protein